MLGLELLDLGKVGSASEGAKWPMSSEGGSKTGDIAVERYRAAMASVACWRAGGLATSHPTV